MIKKVFISLLIMCFSGLHAQEIQSLYKTKKMLPSRDTIFIDSVSINPSFFKILDKNNQIIDTSFYKINFQKSALVFNSNYGSRDTLTIRYFELPKFLTQEYSIYDKKRVVSNEKGALFVVEQENKNTFIPFDGLSTSGSITRGITVGNNQNAVVNSNLDLQIIGKISDKISLRASIQDTNIPLQEGGQSQRLDEFDQIFIELFSKDWSVRAGDLFLENRASKFLNFNKKVQGISSNFQFGSEDAKTNIFGAAALVRGQYTKSVFVGQEGNQGPYKLRGPNNELFVLVISGSERVFVNGVLLKRGENNDYIIDYNAGEITFTSLFPITSEMRITIEYQFSDRNYTRFVTYAGANHETKKWSIGGYLYSENDVKNQPIQQTLTTEQALVLSNAGDNTDLMNAPSAFEDTFSENKILYKKVLLNGVEILELSSNPEDELFNVRFSLQGENLGNYRLTNAAAVGRIYEYVEPINGVKQGNYEPIIRLIAPTKIQIATVMGHFNPSEKTNIDFEMGLSNNDLNLFSNQDDSNNQGLAGKINLKQRLFSKKWTVDFFSNYQFIQKEFRTIERLFAIEFDRDWNLTNPLGNQSLLISGVSFQLPQKGNLTYQFENLNFTESFSGNRHVLNAFFNLKNWTIQNNGSFLKSDGAFSSSEFLRNAIKAKYNWTKNWVGSSVEIEDNQEILKATGLFSALSQRFTEYGAFVGRGDSTKVFAEMGYLKRVNDSLQNGILQRVNTSDSYYLKSKLVQNEKTDLAVYVNYRTLFFEDENRENEPSLNSRILYNTRFFDQKIQISTSYENTSGSIAQQEFTYLEVEPGQGVYVWNDYNANGIQDLEEFEVAPFPDQAKFLRVFLPNQIFLRTHQNRFSQSVTLNPLSWQNEKGFQKILSYFYNQTSYLTERRIARSGSNFDLNPFTSSDENLLGLNTNFRNSLFYNRGKQKHSVTYTFLNSRVKNLLSVGSQENKNKSHQLQYLHLYAKSWLVNLAAKTIGTSLASENFAARNFEIDGFEVGPKLTYLFSKSTSWDIFYEYQEKRNILGMATSLQQNRFGSSFTYSGKKQFTMNGEVSLFQNKFEGNALAPVAFQMLEGLQVGENLTWRLLIQKNLTQFLDININYQGRKSETSKAIHTGSVQLRAYF